MKLIELNINKFKNIIDSNLVKIENDITCLVGKNESGKTSFLRVIVKCCVWRI